MSNPRRHAYQIAARRTPPALLVWPAVAVVATLFVYAPVTRGFFAGDDFCHFLDALDLPAWRFLTQPWGGHVLITTNAVMWVMFRLFGMHPSIYLSAMLAVHALNTFLLYRLTLRYTGRTAVAGMGAALWGTSFLHVVTLSWFSILGEVILTTLTLGLLIALDAARERGTARPLDLAGWSVLALMSSASFGMGLAVGILLPLLVLLLGPAELSRRARIAISVVPLATILVYVAVRAFAPEESDHLLSVRAALGAWRYGLAMFLYMVGYVLSVLSVPFLGAPTGEPTAWRLVIGGVCAVVITSAALTASSLSRRRIVAVTGLATLAYAIVAAGRAAVFQQTAFSPGQAATIPLHYHTFPSIGLVLCLCLAWSILTPSGTRRAAAARIAAGVWVVAWTVGVLLTTPAFQASNQARDDVAAALHDIRTQVAAAPVGTVTIPNRPVTLGRGVPCNTFGLAGVFLMATGGSGTLDGRTVRFSIPTREWQAARERGGRVFELLVPDGS